MLTAAVVYSAHVLNAAIHRVLERFNISDLRESVSSTPVAATTTASVPAVPAAAASLPPTAIGIMPMLRRVASSSSVAAANFSPTLSLVDQQPALLKVSATFPPAATLRSSSQLPLFAAGTGAASASDHAPLSVEDVQLLLARTRSTDAMLHMIQRGIAPSRIQTPTASRPPSPSPSSARFESPTPLSAGPGPSLTPASLRRTCSASSPLSAAATRPAMPAPVSLAGYATRTRIPVQG
jgi:hypothetical protein